MKGPILADHEKFGLATFIICLIPFLINLLSKILPGEHTHTPHVHPAKLACVNCHTGNSSQEVADSAALYLLFAQFARELQESCSDTVKSLPLCSCYAWLTSVGSNRSAVTPAHQCNKKSITAHDLPVFGDAVLGMPLGMFGLPTDFS